MAKTASLSDEELEAEAQSVMADRAADDEKHRARLVEIREERDRRIARARAAELKAALDELPEDVRAEVIGG